MITDCSCQNEKLLPSEKYRWLKNATLYVGGQHGYQGVIEIYQSDNVDVPIWKSAKGKHHPFPDSQYLSYHCLTEF